MARPRSLARLQATTIRTNIRADKARRKERQFGWIESFADVIDERTKTSKGMSITLSDWFYEGVVMDGGLLAIDPAYFGIKGGRERWLYRVARKHAGGAGEEGFAISLPTLFEKSGAEGPYGGSSSRSLRSSARAPFPASSCALRTRSRASRRCAWCAVRILQPRMARFAWMIGLAVRPIIL